MSRPAHDGTHAHHHGHDHDHHHAHDHSHDHHHPQGFWASLRHSLTPHSHDSAELALSAEESTAQGIRTAWISLIGMALTAAAQMVIVWLSGSLALLADTIHNLGHLATTIPLILAFRLGRRAPTSRYPYGYRRAEDLVGLFITSIIAVTIVLIVWESLRGLAEPREPTHLGWVFGAGIVGFLGNEIVAEYRIRTGRRIGSAALIAEGQHARADGLTSIAVVLGVVGVWMGFTRADAIAGLLIAAVIAGTLVNSLRIIVRRLMDGVDPALTAQLTAAVAAVPGVLAVEGVRTRWMGHRLGADARVVVGNTLSVSQADDVATAVRTALTSAVGNLDDVVVQVVPERAPA
ncbi:MAG: cation diffusion facilitator family transporter [bacterium]|nr:cation diffusion facilitator family transporter [bacterium]